MMRINIAKRQINSFVLAMGLVSVFGVGCSGSQQEETAELETTKEEPEAVEAEEAAVTEEPTPVAEVPASPAATGSVDQNRVVRYVTADDSTIRGQPNDTAEAVGKLQKGDMVLVIEENGWCKISDSMFIKADALTSKAVARKRSPATWHKHGH